MFLRHALNNVNTLSTARFLGHKTFYQVRNCLESAFKVLLISHLHILGRAMHQVFSQLKSNNTLIHMQAEQTSMSTAR